jgi:putative glutamine amidotransferase
MSNRPIIGYVTRSGITTPEYRVPRFANNESYARAIVDNGGAPVMIPAVGDEEALAAIYETLDGLLLTGGPDVDPARYGHARHTLTDSGDPPMERAELYLAGRALHEGKPVFGICRGIQTLNVAAGGTLYQDIDDELHTPIEHPGDGHPRDYLAHTVSVTEGSRLAGALGRTEIAVNSLHHQAVRDLGEGFAATATAPDGVVEAIETNGTAYAVGVQWHPEELYRAEQSFADLFRSFVSAARDFAGSRRQVPVG